MKTFTVLLLLICLACGQKQTESTEEVSEEVIEGTTTETATETTVDTAAYEEADEQPPISFCCNNHAPSHCAKDKAELTKFSNQKNCVFQ